MASVLFPSQQLLQVDVIDHHLHTLRIQRLQWYPFQHPRTCSEQPRVLDGTDCRLALHWLPFRSEERQPPSPRLRGLGGALHPRFFCPYLGIFLPEVNCIIITEHTSIPSDVTVHPGHIPVLVFPPRRKGWISSTLATLAKSSYTSSVVFSMRCGRPLHTGSWAQCRMIPPSWRISPDFVSMLTLLHYVIFLIHLKFSADKSMQSAGAACVWRADAVKLP
jgi:hypothetical protein